MATLASILTKMRAVAVKTPDNQYENIWLSRTSQNEDGEYTNQPTSVEVLAGDISDEYIYNLWARTTEDGLAEMDEFVENELIPNGMQLLEKTEQLSANKNAVRFMIARQLTS